MKILLAVALFGANLLVPGAEGQEHPSKSVPIVCPALSAWFGAWEDVAEVTTESFQSIDSRSYAVAPTRYELNYREYLVKAGIPWELQSEILAFSPDSSYAIDEWLFGVDADSVGLFSARDPDTFVGLVDVRRGTAAVVLNGGTPLAVHMTCWLNPTAFTIAGTVQNNTVPGFNLMVWQYDLAAETVLTFQGPFLNPGTPPRSFKAWETERKPANLR